MADLDVEAQALSEYEEPDPRSVPPPPKSLSSLRFLEGALAKLASAVDGADADPTPDARAGFVELESTLTKTLASWEALKAGSLAALNAKLRQAGEPPIDLESGCSRAGASMESKMTRMPSKVAGFLFCSGLTALIYQTIWSRQFRLIFGSSTYATAAVLAIFMGGLGVGSLLLGKRADGKARPLEFYGNLELAIAVTAALSQPLLSMAGAVYVGLGGSATLGLGGASAVRLVLAAVVIGVPTFLMGGTLPAAARAIETGDDVRRRRVAVLYAANTVGAVAGALLSTFWMVERFGNRKTLLMAALVNLFVGVLARAAARRETPPAKSAEQTRTDSAGTPVPPRFVFAAAAVTGFAFLLMEMVWYRMLTPLLGGTTFMFGLVLAIALLGIGAGGAAYSFWRSDRAASAAAFALTCALEAAAMALPFALGDRLAVLANSLQPRGVGTFGGQVLSWSLVTLITVFPAAFVSGIQFPLLINLLGSGRDKVGRDVGAAYAWNTAGAIAGSLAGGFGLMQLLSAPGCWRLVIALLAALAVGTVAPRGDGPPNGDRDGGGRIRGSGDRRGVRGRSHGGLETLGDRRGPRPERSVTQRTAQVGAANTPHALVGRRRARKRHRSRERAGFFLLHQRQVRRVGVRGRRDSGDVRSGGSRLARRAPLGAGDRTGDREHGRMAGRRRLDRACGCGRARAGRAADRGGLRPCQPRRAAEPQGPHPHRRRA